MMRFRSRPENKAVTVVGAGLAGLACGYYAARAGFAATILERLERVGGIAQTLQVGGYRFDTGAHRFHDQDPGVTEEIEKLLGGAFPRIEIPSAIYYDGRFLDFPLSPVDLIRKLGTGKFIRAGRELVKARLKNKPPEDNLQDFSNRVYGETISNLFLTNYSRKLWGRPGDCISSEVARKRLKGLDFKTFFLEMFFGSLVKTRHLDGSFCYPRMGIGKIADVLAEHIGFENIKTGHRVTAIRHDGNRIVELETSRKVRFPVNEVIFTIPITEVISLLEPSPGKEIHRTGDSLAYRSLILVTLFLNRDQITPYGCVYFPDSDFPFTRVYEPNRRSPDMAPEGKTSLVAEIPCDYRDRLWNLPDQELTGIVSDTLSDLALIRQNEIEGVFVYRIQFAYPRLDVGYREKTKLLNQFLNRFQNLSLVGRQAGFEYGSMHHIIRSSRCVVEELSLRQLKDFRSGAMGVQAV